MDEKELDRFIDQLLRDLAGNEEKKAQAAFDHLRRLSKSWLRTFVIHLGGVAARNVDDIIQVAYINVWKSRKRLGVLTHKSWPRYLCRIAENRAIDLFRIKVVDDNIWTHQCKDLSDKERVELARFQALLNRDDRLEHFLAHADMLWLGLDPALSFETHRRQALAAQYYYIDSASYEEIIEMLPSGLDGASLTPAILDTWLVQEGVIRALAYHELFFTNDRLAWYLLGKQGPVRVDQLDMLSEPIRDQDDVLLPEIAVILWRYRYGMQMNQILTRKDCPYDQAQLCCLVASLEQRLPFYNQMERICALFATKLEVERVRAVLRTPGIWQRLAFQYYYLEELGLADISQRLARAAQIVGYDVTTGNLNMWLSGKRLIERLAKSVPRLQGEDTDE